METYDVTDNDGNLIAKVPKWKQRDLLAQLRAAVDDYVEQPTPQNRALLADLARLFVHAVDQRAAVIEAMRQRVTPCEQALSELLTPQDRL
jgi:hypothetical protein